MPTRLKVLQVGKFYPPHRGGMETHLETLCQSLKDRVDIDVVVANSGSETEVGLVNDIPVTRLRTMMRVASTSITLELVRKVRTTDAHIVHVHLPNPWAVFCVFLSGTKLPIVTTYHSDIVRQRVLGTLYGPLQEWFMKRCSTVIVTSSNMLNHSSQLSRYGAKLSVIPLGVSASLLNPPDVADVLRIRAEYGQRLVLAVGRLVEYKGIGYLIQAMNHVDGKLLIVGTGPLGKKLSDLSKTLGLERRVVFLGEVPANELRAIYHACDVFALPSIASNEAFGLVQVEAMAAGRPVVNTELPSGVPFVSKHGETGYTVPPKSPKQLARAINVLLSDDALRERLGNAARDRVWSLFTAERMATETLRVYETVYESVHEHAPGRQPVRSSLQHIAPPRAQSSARTVVGFRD